jgi:hypothetical protein
MKAALRDVLLILLLFGAIALAPVVADFFLGGNATPVATPPPAVSPPPPRPAAQRQAQLRPLRDLSFKPDAVQSRPSGAGCRLGGIRSYRGGIPRAAGDMFIVSGTSAAQRAVPIQFDGNAGIDTLKVDGPGYVDLDGVSIARIEIVDLRNGAQNALNALTAGLVTLDTGHVVVVGANRIPFASTPVCTGTRLRLFPKVRNPTCGTTPTTMPAILPLSASRKASGSSPLKGNATAAGTFAGRARHGTAGD